MKHFMTYAFAGALVATLLTASASAGSTVDKGALGKYERQGRFLKPIMAPTPRSGGDARVVLPLSEGRVIIDKGALGKYERKGRFVKPIVEKVQNNWPNRGRRMEESGVKHMHGLNGKEHRIVKN